MKVLPGSWGCLLRCSEESLVLHLLCSSGFNLLNPSREAVFVTPQVQLVRVLY